MFQGMKCVVHGADHIKNNKICQDAAGVCENEHFSAAVVSDGHGGSKYIRSEIGSKFAVEAAIETVCDYMKDFDCFTAAIKKNPDYMLNQMERYLITKWMEKIEIHHDDFDLTSEEQFIIEKEKQKGDKDIDWHSYYGCTVLVAVMAEGYFYGMLVGDGTFCVVYEDGSVSIPIEDPYSVANMTSSICDKQSKDRFQHYYEDKQPLSITVSSDGLCKSFGSEESLKDYHVRLTYMMNTEQVASSLEKNLQNFTQKGSGDDISVATVFHADILNEKKAMLLKIIEEQKKLEQERKVIEQKRQEEMKRKMELARQEEERRRQEEELRRQAEERRRQEERRRREEELRRQKERRRKMEDFCQQVKTGLKPGYTGRNQGFSTDQIRQEQLLRTEQEQKLREQQLKAQEEHLKEQEERLNRQQRELEQAKYKTQRGRLTGISDDRIVLGMVQDVKDMIGRMPNEDLVYGQTVLGRPFSMRGKIEYGAQQPGAIPEQKLKGQEDIMETKEIKENEQ